MTPAPATDGEQARLAALHRLDILDTDPEEAFDRVALLAQRLFATPVALVSFAGPDGQWFKSRIGLERGEAPHAAACCDHIIDVDGVLVVADARSDPRFADHPGLRLGRIGFFAGAPLITREGHRIGALCVIDRAPRPEVTEAAAGELALLAGIVMSELELRVAHRQLAAEFVSRNLAEGRLRLLGDLTEAALAAADFKTAIRACLHLIAERIGACCAFAYGLAAHAPHCELEAEYSVPGSDVEAYLDFVRQFPLREDNSIIGACVLHQRLVAIADLRTTDQHRNPGVRVAVGHGFVSLLGVPFENAGTKFALMFIFRPPPRDMSLMAETIHSLSGKVRDLLARKRVEEALRREKEFSEFLIRSSTEGILVFDREFRVSLWNPGIERITGIGAEQVLGRNLLEALSSALGAAGEAAMRAALAGSETSLDDQRYSVARTGREGFFEAYFAPLYSRGREVIGGIGFLRETTERRRIEDALRQSQKMEAVGQLTGGIAHDFNNMLTVIAGNLELLETKLADQPRLLRLINSAGLAASRAGKLTQQLLTFSRRQQLRPQPIDFNQIIIGMDDLLHRTVGEHIEIREQLSAELWPALADPNQIEMALLNLILNARDAIRHPGRITIETGNIVITARQGDVTPGAYATLAVSDTGQGMSEEVLAHVFEPFFTTKEVGKGTGLGLAQVYGFIIQSSGHVRIESRVGEGTTVRLYLPRAGGIAGATGMTPIGAGQYRGNETVLVAEDDRGVRDFAVAVLRELGYRVLEAATGDAALALVDGTSDIDLLFTDVVMPGALNGADLARAALERRPELRVLFTSGYTTRLVERDWPASAADLLRKPYRSIDLAQRVRAALDRSRVAAQ